MLFLVLGNVFCGLSSLLVLISTFSKSKKSILALQSIDCIAAIIGNLLLGGWSGAVICSYSMIRNLVCIKYELSNFLSMLFVILAGVIGVFVNDDGLLGVFCIIASIEYTAFVCFCKNATTIKFGMIINIVLYAIYDIVIQSYLAIVISLITTSLLIINLVRNSKEKVDGDKIDG